MSYSYHISTTGIAGTYTEVFPSIIPKLKTKLENNTDDFRWCYRKSCSEIKITKRLNSAVYATLLSWFTDSSKFATQIFIKIYRGGTSGTLVYTGYFSIKNVRINTDNTFATFTPITQDEYTIFDKVKNTDVYAWHTIPGTNTVRWPNGTKTLGTWTNVSFDLLNVSGADIIDARDTAGGGEDCYITVTGTFLSNQTVVVNFSSYTKISGTNPIIYIMESSGLLQISTASHTLSAAGEYTFSLDTASPSYTNPRLYISTTNTVRFNCVLASMNSYFPRKGTTDVIWDGKKLVDFIAYFTDDRLDTGYTSTDIKSTFIWNDALPSVSPSAIDTYITANPTHNYVTEDPNNINDLYIIYRTLFKESSGGGIQPYYTKFTTLMNDLNYYLNVYWYIDSDGNFRIEHYKYFEELRTSGIDLTDAAYTKYKPEEGLREYEFDNAETYQREHWEASYDKNEDFLGSDIVYSSIETSDSVKDHRGSLINTDIENLYSTITDGVEGVALVQCVPVGSYFDINYETGELSALSVANGHLSIANCHNAYWYNGRYAKTGTINGASVTFDTTVPMIQSSVKFPDLTDLNDYGYITTSFGDGIIDEYERDLNSDFITASLLFNI